ncbi:hypothetical protein, partial [uncultured Campylobacter sp.]|uniref:hypothetical protein n=1 Tax=uncultured Campylobacter sp. TaxID=218934 RepID=UPI00260C6165
PLRRNFKLRALNLSLNLGRASYKFKAQAKFSSQTCSIFTPPQIRCVEFQILARNKISNCG